MSAANPTNLSGPDVPERLQSAWEIAERKGIPTAEALRQIDTAAAPESEVPESEREARRLRDEIAAKTSALDQLEAATREVQQGLVVRRKLRDAMVERIYLVRQQLASVDPSGAELENVIGDPHRAGTIDQLVFALQRVENARAVTRALTAWLEKAVPQLAELSADYDEFARTSGLLQPVVE